MTIPLVRHSRQCLLAAAALLLLPAHLQAQTSRAGSGARPTSSRVGAGSRVSGGGSASLSASASGPRQYRSNTLLGDATIQIDPETRSLVIVTDDATHGELMKVIKTLDQPKPQVLIKVVFVEVTYNKGYDVGLEANYTFDQSSAIPAGPASTSTTNTVVAESGTNTLGGTTTTTTTGNNAITNAASAAVAAGATKLITAGNNFGLAALTEGTFVRVLTDDWSATLRLLATRGKVEVLSRPSIMARNNQEAVIVVGQEVPLITNSRTDALGQLTNTISYDNVGIILRVTPFITSDGTVEMIVAPEISSLNTNQTVPISSTASAPTIDKRSAETVVVTPDGATVVIGGLMQTQRIESIRKVPLLGDIPWLGAAFRRTIKDDLKRELMIFLTPTIVNNPATLRRTTNDEMARADGINKAFTGEDFDKYLGPQVLPEPLPEVPLGDKEVRREIRTETTQPIATPPRPMPATTTTTTTTTRTPPTPTRPTPSSIAPKSITTSRQRPPK